MFSTTPGARATLLAEFPELAAYGRVAVRLHPRPGAPGTRDSSVGGPLLWPAGEEWPMCAEEHTVPRPRKPAGDANALLERRKARFAALGMPLPPGLSRRKTADGTTDGTAEGATDGATDGAADRTPAQLPAAEPDLGPVVMAPVLQLFQRDAPGADFFPAGADLLQLLWCPAEHAGPRPLLPRAFWRSADAIGAPLEHAPALNRVFGDRYVPRPCVVHPEQVVEYPPVRLLAGDPEKGLFGLLPAELETRIRRRDLEQPDSYTYDVLAHAPGWKAGGWERSAPEPDALVACACGAPMRPLLETFVDEQLRGAWAPVGTPGFAWGDPDDRHDQEPTGVSVARDGATWVRVCTADPRHPLDHGLS